jgi:hypothetical protein
MTLRRVFSGKLVLGINTPFGMLNPITPGNLKCMTTNIRTQRTCNCQDGQCSLGGCSSPSQRDLGIAFHRPLLCFGNPQGNLFSVYLGECALFLGRYKAGELRCVSGAAECERDWVGCMSHTTVPKATLVRARGKLVRSII